MNLSNNYCNVCRDTTLHKGPQCIGCGTIEATTHPAAYRDEMALLSGTSRSAMAAKRKRGQINSRLSQRAH